MIEKTESPAAEPTVEAAAAPAAAPSPASEGERPAWLPEKFKTPEDLAKSYLELDQWRGKKEEELALAVLKDRPEAQDKYELPTFDGDLVDQNALAEHPLVGWWREQAFKRGLSQTEFQDGISKYVEALTANIPNPDAEKQKLGENAGARIERVTAWANATFKEADEFAVVQQIGTTAAGIKVLERVMNATRSETGDPLENGNGLPPQQDDEATIRKLMDSKEYWNPTHRDPHVVARVQKFFQTRYSA